MRNTIHALRASQNAQDRTLDMANLHELMRTALTENDDVTAIEVLQIARSEMPEVITTLERALECVIEDGQQDTEESTTALQSGKGIGVTTLSSTSSKTGADISAVFLPTREAVGDQTQIIDHGIDLQVELPTADELRASQPSPPLANLPPELRYSNPIFNTPTTQSTTGASAPAVSFGGSAASTASALTQFLFAPLAPSPSHSFAGFSERGSGHESDGDGATTPMSTQRSNSNQNRAIPIKEYIRTRSVRPFLSLSKTDTHAL